MLVGILVLVCVTLVGLALVVRSATLTNFSNSLYTPKWHPPSFVPAFGIVLVIFGVAGMILGLTINARARKVSCWRVRPVHTVESTVSSCLAT